MGKYRLKITCFLSFLLLVGCTSYRIPIQVENHPASSDTAITQVQLSSILDLNESIPVYKSEICSSEEDVEVYK